MSRKKIDPVVLPQSIDQETVQAGFPPCFAPMFLANRYKICYGGRGGGKTMSIARALVLMGSQRPLRILCCRELMSSIADSSHQSLTDAIVDLKLDAFYVIERDRISGKNGTTFRFAGLRNNISSIKSFAHLDIVWCDEASSISKTSFEILIPTMRDGMTLETSEIWISFNPTWRDDAVMTFVTDPPPGATVIKMNYDANPFFPAVLREEMELMQLRDFDNFRHVWLGECRRYLEGCVYAQEIKAAEAEDRFTRVPYDPKCPVEAFVDIGWADKTVILLAQVVGFEVHVIDHVEGRRATLDHYLKILSERPYPIDRFHLPHDGTSRQIGTGLSIAEMLRNKGKKVSIVPKLGIAEGINAVRSTFPSMYWDAARCAGAIEALRNYRYAVQKDGHGGYTNEPLHDDSSHVADATRYLCIALRKPKQKREVSYAVPRLRWDAGQDSWMAL